MTQDTAESSLRADRRAVAPLIGIILIFATLVVVYAGYQAEVVPNQNNEIEFQHFEDVQNEMVDVRRAVLAAGQADVSQFATVTLGTDYPARLIALNPPTPVGTLQTSDPYNITIQNESDKPEGKINVSTRFIEYQNRYNELEADTIRYENSVLYIDTRANSGNPVILEDQNLVSNGTLRLTALQNEFRESGTRRVTVELTPTRNITADEIPTGNLTVTIPTRLGEEYWDEALASEDLYDGVNKSTDRFDDDVYALNLSNITSEDLEINTVGIQEEPEDSDSVKQRVGVPEPSEPFEGEPFVEGNQSNCAGDIDQLNNQGAGYQINFEIRNNQTCESIVLTGFSLSYNRSGSGPNEFDQLSRKGTGGQGQGNDAPRRDNEINVSPVGKGGQPGSATAGTPNEGFEINGGINKFDNNPIINSSQIAEINLGYFEDDSSNVVEFKEYEIRSEQPDGETHIQLNLYFQDSSRTEVYIVPTGGFNT